MKRKKIIRVFNNSLKKISKHYNNMLEDFELEEIHDFRVEMKKLRAFIRLVNAEVSKRKNIKISKEIKAFYGTVGTIRNIQLQKQRIVQYCIALSTDIPEQYLELLNEEETREKKKSRIEAQEICFPNSRKSFIKSVPQELSAASIRYFFTGKRTELLSLISLSKYEDETLHDIRKILKDILYDWDYISPYLASVLPEYFLHKENIESLTDKLGDFHDLCVALSFLAPIYIDQVINGPQADNLTNIKRRIEWEKYHSKEEIILLFEFIKNQVWVENTLKNVCETINDV